MYVKPTNTGLLLHYKSHVDDRYKRGLLKTMLDRAYRLSSNWHYFSEECDRLKLVFSRLKYPDNLVNSTIVLSYRLKIRHQHIIQQASAYNSTFINSFDKTKFLTISKDTPNSLRFDRCYPLNSTTKEYLEVKKNCFNTFTKLLQDISTAKEINWKAKCQNCGNEMVF